MISRIDEAGNVLLIENSRFGINLYIRLEAEKHRMHKGTIDELNKIMFIEVDEHKLRYAYPINHFILTTAKKFKDVVIIEYPQYPDPSNQYNIYQIPVDVILSKGIIYGKENGFAKHIYISKEVMEQFKINSDEKINFMKQFKKVK